MFFGRVSTKLLWKQERVDERNRRLEGSNIRLRTLVDHLYRYLIGDHPGQLLGILVLLDPGVDENIVKQFSEH